MRPQEYDWGGGEKCRHGNQKDGTLDHVATHHPASLSYQVDHEGSTPVQPVMETRSGVLEGGVGTCTQKY